LKGADEVFSVFLALSGQTRFRTDSEVIEPDRLRTLVLRVEIFGTNIRVRIRAGLVRLRRSRKSQNSPLESRFRVYVFQCASATEAGKDRLRYVDTGTP
jgi:hypothetical protein